SECCAAAAFDLRKIQTAADTARPPFPSSRDRSASSYRSQNDRTPPKGRLASSLPRPDRWTAARNAPARLRYKEARGYRACTRTRPSAQPRKTRASADDRSRAVRPDAPSALLLIVSALPASPCRTDTRPHCTCRASAGSSTCSKLLLFRGITEQKGAHRSRKGFVP